MTPTRGFTAAARLLAATAAVLFAPAALADPVNSTTCNGKYYAYNELAGYGFVSSFAKDKFGDTIGGQGSAIALDTKTWTKLSNGSYTGILWAMPDRGWNTEGTLNYIPRIHKYSILFTPQPGATLAAPAAPNLLFTYLDSVLLSGPDGKPGTGLDGDPTGDLYYPGFPPLPIASYTGDGFGGPGCPGKTSHRVPLDTEGLVLNADGSFWVSDEYGPYVYLFSSEGKMLTAIRPPEAIIPKRNGTDSFSADSPAFYVNGGAGDDVSPADNPTGRDNNHGFEGLSVTEDGKTLWVLLQAAANQEGGLAKQTERYTRLLKYDISQPTAPVYLAEYVVPLPLFNNPTAKASKNPQAAAQSELHVLPNGQFFFLPRDSGAGHGQSNSLSVYRHIDVFDIAGATDIKGDAYDCADCSVAPGGVLAAGVAPATLCPFLDFNVNDQLGRFGLHNGGAQDAQLLNEKWESIALAPVNPGAGDGEYYVFSLSDNDFITQNGTLKFGQFHYADASGFSLDNQALVFHVSIPS